VRKVQLPSGRYQLDLARSLSRRDIPLEIILGRRILTADDCTQAAEALTVMHAEIFERIAHLALALIGAASSDPELDRYLTDTRASVHLQLQRILDVYRDRGGLRKDIPFDELVETTAVLCSAETYLQITHSGGWSVTAYRTWLRRMLTETIFHPPQAN
jgi:hypothetical protein